MKNQIEPIRFANPWNIRTHMYNTSKAYQLMKFGKFLILVRNMKSIQLSVIEFGKKILVVYQVALPIFIKMQKDIRSACKEYAEQLAKIRLAS